MKKKFLSIFIALVLALSLSLVTAAPVAAADLSVPGTYTTIQAAVNAASPGDIIIVAAGTYDEQVVIDKALTLQGAGSGVTSIEPTTGRPVTLLGWSLPARPIDGFRIQGFTLVTADASHAFLAGSGSPDNNPYTTNLELEDIVVDGGQRGIGLNAVQGATFSNVHLSNISGSPEAALELTGVYNLLFTQGSIEGNDIGVRLQPTGEGDIGEGYGPNGNIQIHSSSLVGNIVAIENQDSGTEIDAENNWWGTSVASEVAAMVSGNVDYDPWLLSPSGSKAAILRGSGVPGKGLLNAPGQQKAFNPKSQAAEHAGKKVK